MDEKSLQILVVEDNLTDMLLLEEILEEVRTSQFALTHVKRLDEALRRLHDRRFDAVLLDLGLPDSQGLETFFRMQSASPASPILILSGLNDEALSVRAVQEGAQDFLVKGMIDSILLARTIRYAIERKRSEQRLMASELGYRRLFETAQDGIFILDGETSQITDANPYLETLLGHPTTDFIGKCLWEIAPFRGKESSQAAFRTLREKGQIRYDALPLLARGGREVVIEFVSNVYAVGNQQVIQCNLRDITERKLAEARLLVSESNLARSQQMAHLGSWELDLSNLDDINVNSLHWSDETFRILGYTPGEFEPSNEAFFRAVHPDDTANLNRMMAGAVRGGDSYCVDHRILWPDGTEHIIHSEAEIIYSEESGLPLRIVGVGQDITDRRHAEISLAESQQRLALATESARIGIWDWDVVANKMVWDPLMFALYGIHKGDFTGAYDAWENGVHPDDRESAAADITAALDGTRDFHAQFRVVWPSGEVRHIEAHAVVLRASDGSSQRMIGVNWDITERKQAEAQLLYVLKNVRCLLWFGSVVRWTGGNITWDQNVTDLQAAQAFCPLELAPGQRYQEAAYQSRLPEDRAVTDRLVLEAFNAGSPEYEIEFRQRDANGVVRWFSEQASIEEHPICPAATDTEPRKQEWWVVGVCTDITERKRAETALLQAHEGLEARVAERTRDLVVATQEAEAVRREAENANRAKSEFLSRMSHELRTPLNAILGFGQILDRQTLTSLQQESVRYILKGGQHLLGLINEVLDIARVEAGHIQLSIEPTALGEILSEACALMRPLTTERGVRLDENLSALGLAYVMADRQRLKQVLINLLSNAIKYNHPGGAVEVSCHDAPNDRVRIAIRDTGPGIRAEHLPKLFTPFERLDAVNSDIEGTGLGLALSQRLITAMGGTLGVESVVGEGSIFSIELPRAQHSVDVQAHWQAGGDRLDITTLSPRRFTVLNIEDNISNLRLLEVVLASRPEITLLAAIQGSIGLDIARQQKPDLILLDMHLPDLTGSDVLARLKQSASTQDIPVIMISADATPSQIERLLGAGARAYLTKPLDIDEFLKTIDEILLATDLSFHDAATLEDSA